MNNEIKIVMGGYLDENDRLMDRSELNKRIKSIQEELETTKNLLDEARTLIEEMCVDDCGIDLAKEDRESLEAIIMGNDEKCSKFLEKLKTISNGN